MKTKFCKILFAILLMPLMALGNINAKNGKYTEEKQISKEFSVTKDALLKVRNSYGNIDITVWDQEKTAIEVVIKVNGNDREKIQEKLKEIDVYFEATPAQVLAETKFNEGTSSTWWNKLATSWASISWGGDNVNVEVNYTIKLPVTNKLDLVNDYGSISIDENLGGCKINCDYGQLILGELNSESNQINMDYTNNSTIKFIKKGVMNADYSDFVIDNAGALDLNADYSKSFIEKANLLNFVCDYGSLRLGDMGVVKGNGDYVGIKIESVSEALAINSDYGSVTVAHLKPSLKTVLVKTDYSGVRLHYDEDFNFNFKLKSSYGSIKIDDNDLTIMKKNVENTSKDYVGFRGEKNTNAEVVVSTSYGGIKLNNYNLK